MSHTSEKRWGFAAEVVSASASKLVEAIANFEEVYQDLLELYSYVGNTPQALADLLFQDNWQVRGNKGVKARLSYDVVSGIVTNAAVDIAGTGYTDGTDFEIQVPGVVNNLARLRFDVVSGSVTNASVFSGGQGYIDGVGFLTNEQMPEPGFVYETEANAEEVAKAQDLINAATAGHEIYQAANDVAVAQEDRMVQLRRFT